MGLITGLITLPLAPARGVVWVAEQIRAEAERQWSDPAVVRAELEQLEQAHRDGLISDAERDERADALVQRLLPPSGGRGR
jgi:hypothetical protein